MGGNLTPRIGVLGERLKRLGNEVGERNTEVARRMERLPTETAIAETMRRFKEIALVTTTKETT